MALSLGVIAALLVMLTLIALGVPVFFAFAVGGYLIIHFTGVFPSVFITTQYFDAIEFFTLIAIPLFILTGDIVVESGLGRKLMDFAEDLVGGLKTGLGSATVLGCGLFASISGSNAADAAAIGRITHGSLKDAGYPGSYGSALVASGASTGILIPPSIAYIIIGYVLGISASDLFLAALIPGSLILLTVLVTNIAVNNRRNYERSRHSTTNLRDVLESTWNAKGAIAIPVILLGGIYSGVFTPTESAAVAAFVGIVIGMTTENLQWSSFPSMFERSAVINGIILPIVAISVALSQVFAGIGLPQTLADFLLSLTQNYYLTILTFLLILLIAGAFMDLVPNILILGPLLLPIARNIGMDPMHFAVFLNSALAVGFITPPLGINLYVMAGITDEPITEIAWYAIPFMSALIVTVVVIGFFSPISMFFF